MWNERVIEGKLMWESDHGTVFKTPDGKFVAGVPRVIKLGPFDTVEEAKQAAEDPEGNLDRTIETYNLQLTNLSNAVRGQ
jgi:hypothetical protein